MADWRPSAEIRRTNLRLVVERWGTVEVCRRLEISRQYLNQLIGPNPIRRVGHPLARRIELTFDLPLNSLDSVHDTPSELQQLIDAARELPPEMLRPLIEMLQKALELHHKNK